MIAEPRINDFIEQVRFRVKEAERKFQDDLKALNSTQAAKGLLRSGSTIAKTLRILEGQFAELTDRILADLGRAVAATRLDPAEMHGLSDQLLSQSAISFKSTVQRERLEAFAPSKSVSKVIDESFARIDERLTLSLREFAFGLSNAPAGSPLVPASGRYVQLADNQREAVAMPIAELKTALVESNEGTEEDKLIALSEIAIFEAAIIQPRVPTELIDRFVRFVRNTLLKNVRCGSRSCRGTEVNRGTLAIDVKKHAKDPCRGVIGPPRRATNAPHHGRHGDHHHQARRGADRASGCTGG